MNKTYYKRGIRAYNTRRRNHTARQNLLILIVFLALLAAFIIGSMLRKSMEPPQIISPLGHSFDFAQGEVYAAEQLVRHQGQYTIPSLNPNLTEREQNISLIRKIWGRDAGTGLEIARCESGYRTHARNVNTNNSVDQGVFQINSVHDMPEMEDAVANISYAHSMFLEQGVSPWASSNNCHHLLNQ